MRLRRYVRTNQSLSKRREVNEFLDTMSARLKSLALAVLENETAAAHAHQAAVRSIRARWRHIAAADRAWVARRELMDQVLLNGGRWIFISPIDTPVYSRFNRTPEDASSLRRRAAAALVFDDWVTAEEAARVLRCTEDALRELST